MSIVAEAASTRTESKRAAARHLRDDGFSGWLFALPHLILFGTFLLAPTLFGFYISLHRWQVLVKSHPYVGFANYQAALSDDIFWLALGNTLYFAVLVVPLGNIVSLLLAVGLSKVRFLATFYKVSFYVPVIISISVVAILWQWLYNTEVGLFNLYIGSAVNALRHAGVHLPPFQPIPWLADPRLAMPSIALMSIWWGAGGNMILYLAGINNIPDDYYEASKLDGATGWRQFWSITWPLLRPTTLFCLVFSALAAFQIFGQSYVLYGGGSGPGRAALTLVLYMYQQGFSEYEIGYGATIAYLLFAIVLLFTVLQFRLLSYGGETCMRYLRRAQIAWHIPLLLLAALFLAPLVWMMSTAFRTPEDIINGLGAMRWLPRPATLENFRQVLQNVQEFPVWRWTGNSMLISSSVTVLVLTVNSLAAFAYSRLRWKARDEVFAVVVATMLVPGQVLLIPTYLLIRGLHWFDTYWALIAGRRKRLRRLPAAPVLHDHTCRA